MKELAEIIPLSIIFAVGIWGLICFMILGPEAATRIAHADYIEQCETNLVATIRASSREQELPFNQSTRVENEAAQTNSAWNSMRGEYSEHTQLLDMLTGGGFSQTIQIQNEAARRARQAREDARAIIRARAVRAAQTAPDQCACQVQMALGESRSEWAMYVATFTLIEQEKVTGFPALMRVSARYCSERVNS